MERVNQQTHGGVTYETATVPYREVPAIGAIIAWAQESGLEETEGGATVSRTLESGLARYRVFGYVSIKCGGLHLKANFQSGAENSKEDAVAAAAFIDGTVGDELPPILYSKHQEGLAMERARQIRAALGLLAEKATQVEVPVATRAGRGGYNSKVARRHFKLSDLA